MEEPYIGQRVRLGVVVWIAPLERRCDPLDPEVEVKTPYGDFLRRLWSCLR